MGDIAHAIGYLVKLATSTALATSRIDGIANSITGEIMTVAFVDADKSHNTSTFYVQLYMFRTTISFIIRSS